MSALSAAANRSSPLSLPVPWCTRTRMSGTKRAASRAQLFTTDVGATISDGPRLVPCACSTASRVSSCRVLPSPMSSASTAPKLLRDMKYSQSTPRRWYSRSSALTVSGMSTRSGAGRSVPPTREVNQGEPVNSIGLSAPASSASWRSSAADTTPSPSAFLSRSYSACASSARRCSSSASSEPAACAMRARLMALSASRMAFSREVSRSFSRYFAVLATSRLSASTHSPRSLIRPDLDLTSWAISSSESSTPPMDSRQSYLTRVSKPIMVTVEESCGSWCSLTLSFDAVSAVAHARGSSTTKPWARRVAALSRTNFTISSPFKYRSQSPAFGSKPWSTVERNRPCCAGSTSEVTAIARSSWPRSTSAVFES